MKKRCEYRYCRTVQSYFDNKTKYCDDDCRDKEKLARQTDQYHEKKKMLNELNRIEGLLRTCYRRYGEEPFDINVLREMRMNWTVTAGELVQNNLTYTRIGSYAYAATQNNQIRIINI